MGIPLGHSPAAWKGLLVRLLWQPAFVSANDFVPGSLQGFAVRVTWARLATDRWTGNPYLELGAIPGSDGIQAFQSGGVPGSRFLNVGVGLEWLPPIR